MNLDRAASFCLISRPRFPIPRCCCLHGAGACLLRLHPVPFYRLQVGSIVKQSLQLRERNRYPGIREQVPYIPQRVALPHGLFDVINQKFRDFPARPPHLFHREASEFFPGGLYLFERIASSRCHKHHLPCRIPFRLPHRRRYSQLNFMDGNALLSIVVIHKKRIWTNIFPYLHIHSLFLFLNSSFKEKQYSLFDFFSGLQGNFSSMLAPKSEASHWQCFLRGNERQSQKPPGVLPYRMVAV